MKKEKLDIVYEDKYLIVINKKSGLLTISTEYEKENTLYHQVLLYLKQKNKNNKVFIVHRLDKDTSGLIIFAKDEKVKRLLQDNWDDVKRVYLGIVNGVTQNEEDILKSYLKETKTHLVYSTKDKNGDLAITKYESLATNKQFSLLKITILTGRKHQIRVQLNDIGYPLVGDKKYSNIKNKNVKRLCLHASYLEFIHPITKEILKLNTKYPREFNDIIEYKKEIFY